jgi:hypothetical protein
MALWNAKESTTIGASEHLGRRRFGHPELRGAAGQQEDIVPHWRDFLEKRDRRISIDRLGHSSVDKKVLRYLRPLAEEQGKKFKPERKFLGWSYIRAAQLKLYGERKGYEVHASPTAEPDRNDYHAHIVPPDEVDNDHAAAYLCTIFADHGAIHDAEDQARTLHKGGLKPPWPVRAIGVVLNFILRRP